MVGVVEEPGVGVGTRGLKPEDEDWVGRDGVAPVIGIRFEAKLEAEGIWVGTEVAMEAELDTWKGVKMATLCFPGSRDVLELEGASFGNDFSTSLSYIKLSVTGKNGASPDAALWM